MRTCLYAPKDVFRLTFCLLHAVLCILCVAGSTAKVQLLQLCSKHACVRFHLQTLVAAGAESHVHAAKPKPAAGVQQAGWEGERPACQLPAAGLGFGGMHMILCISKDTCLFVCHRHMGMLQVVEHCFFNNMEHVQMIGDFVKKLIKLFKLIRLDESHPVIIQFFCKPSVAGMTSRCL